RGWRLNPGYPAVFVGPTVKGGAGAMLEGLEKLRCVALLEHEFGDAVRIAIEDFGVPFVVPGLADHDGRGGVGNAGPLLVGGPVRCGGKRRPYRSARLFPFQSEKRIRQGAQVDARALAEADPAGVGVDTRRRRGEEMAPVPFVAGGE